MALWTVDLTTEDGKLSAAQTGGFACLIAAALTVIGLMMTSMAFATAPATSPAFITIAAIAGAELVIFVTAFFRLRAGKGLIWGCVAAALLVLEIVVRLITLTGLLGIVIDIILLVGVINGIRGVRALGRPGLTAERAGEVFE